MRLSCAMEVTCSINVHTVVGFNLDACDASCLVCHRLFVGEHNSWSMVGWLRLPECFLYDSLLNIIVIVGLCWLNLRMVVLVYYLVGVSHLPDIMNGDYIVSFDPS